MFKFVSENVPDYERLEETLNQIADDLEYEKHEKFDKILDKLGLEVVMGVVVQKGTVK